MYAVLLALALLSAAPAEPSFDLQTLEGQRLSGRLVEVDAKQVTVETATGRVSTPVEKLVSISAKQKPVPPRDATVRVELTDGSILVAEEYTAREGKARIAVAGGDPVELPTGEVASVRFLAGTEVIAAEWARIAGMKLQNDVLVVNKGDSIDYHKGVIHDVTDKQVQFDLDGEVLGVRRAKIYGMIYYHAAAAEVDEAPYSVLDAAGSRWAARSIALADNGGKLEWTTVGGMTVRHALDQVAQIDLSRGKILYLGDLKADSAKYTPYLGLEKELPARLEFFRPRQNQSLEGKPLRLGGKQFAKGLALHSRTEMVYYLPGRFTRLEATAGIDDEVRPRGNVRLVLRGDDKVLWEGTISGTEPPKPLTADLTGVKKLVILADFGEDLDVGDHLDLVDARIIK